MENKEQKSNKRSALMFHSVKGAVIGCITVLLLLILTAEGIKHGKLTPEMAEPLVMGSVVLGAIPAGAYLAKKIGRGALPLGVLAGIGMSVILIFAALIWPEGEVSSLLMVKRILCAISGGAFGGALTIRPKRSKKRKRRQ